jgi:hypothetical protein
VGGFHDAGHPARTRSHAVTNPVIAWLLDVYSGRHRADSDGLCRRRRTPPRHCMLFLLNGAGVPSVGKFVQIY